MSINPHLSLKKVEENENQFICENVVTLRGETRPLVIVIPFDSHFQVGASMIFFEFQQKVYLFLGFKSESILEFLALKCGKITLGTYLLRCCCNLFMDRNIIYLFVSCG